MTPVGHQPRGTYIFFLLPPSYLFLPLFIPSSFLCLLFFILLPHLIPFFYVCVYLSPLSIPSSSSFLYVYPHSICVSPFPLPVLSLSPLFIPSSSSSSSFFYVCMYIFIFYLIFIFGPIWGTFVIIINIWKKFLTIRSSIYLQTNSKAYFIPLLLIFSMSVCIFLFLPYFYFFWTDLGNVCHYNKYMEKFLTVQSSIYLQTNSKTYFIPLLLIFLCLYVYFYFFTLFLFFWTDLGNVCHSNKSLEKIFNHQIIHIFTNEIKKTYFIYFFIF